MANHKVSYEINTFIEVEGDLNEESVVGTLYLKHLPRIGEEVSLGYTLYWAKVKQVKHQRYGVTITFEDLYLDMAEAKDRISKYLRSLIKGAVSYGKENYKESKLLPTIEVEIDGNTFDWDVVEAFVQGGIDEYRKALLNKETRRELIKARENAINGLSQLYTHLLESDQPMEGFGIELRLLEYYEEIAAMGY